MGRSVIDVYDVFGHDYPKYANSQCFFSPLTLFKRTADHTSIEGKVVLDVGIGSGLSSVPFFNAGASITGIDGSHVMLSYCQKRGIAKELIKQDFTVSSELPFESQSFGITYSNCLLRYFQNIEPLISEMVRVTEKEGIISFTTTSPKGKKLVFEDGIGYDRKRTGQLMRDYIHEKAVVQSILDTQAVEVIHEEEICSQKNQFREEYCNLFIARKTN